jgi:hypothetical protein
MTPTIILHIKKKCLQSRLLHLKSTAKEYPTRGNLFSDASQVFFTSCDGIFPPQFIRHVN